MRLRFEATHLLFHRINNDDLSWLKRWWEDEYSQPCVGNHLFEDQTFADIFVRLSQRHCERGGRVVLEEGRIRLLGEGEMAAGAHETGDSVTDEWEKQIAAGEMPDLK